MTSHPALHSVTTDSSECEARSGMTCANRACLGSIGMSSSPSSVDCTFVPLGDITLSGFSAGDLLSSGAYIARKWLVAPESRMAHSLMFSVLMLTVDSSVFAAPANPFVYVLVF